MESMPTSFERDYLVLLHDVARLMRTKADQLARSTMGMTRAQWIILFRLEQSPGLSQKELASILEVEPITVGRLVDKLEARELVERCADPRDRRIWRLALTAKAEPILAQMHVHREEFRKFVSAGIDHPLLQSVTDGLLKMKANLTAGDTAADAK
jgi:DNA-binding MarR family transcriptional regulator